MLVNGISHFHLLSHSHRMRAFMFVQAWFILMRLFFSPNLRLERVIACVCLHRQYAVICAWVFIWMTSETIAWAVNCMEIFIDYIKLIFVEARAYMLLSNVICGRTFLGTHTLRPHHCAKRADICSGFAICHCLGDMLMQKHRASRTPAESPRRMTNHLKCAGNEREIIMNLCRSIKSTQPDSENKFIPRFPWLKSTNFFQMFHQIDTHLAEGLLRISYDDEFVD